MVAKSKNFTNYGDFNIHKLFIILIILYSQHFYEFKIFNLKGESKYK